MAIIAVLAGLSLITFGLTSLKDFRNELQNPTRTLGTLFVTGWVALLTLAIFLVAIVSLIA